MNTRQIISHLYAVAAVHRQEFEDEAKLPGEDGEPGLPRKY